MTDQGKNILSNVVEKIANDKDLKNNIKKISSVQKESLSLFVNNLIDNTTTKQKLYEDLIKDGLKDLSKKYLINWLKDNYSLKNFAVFFSYNSSIAPRSRSANDKFSRIFSFLPSENDNNTFRYIDLVISEVWDRIKSSQPFQVHYFTQKNLFHMKENRFYRRVPFAIKPGKIFSGKFKNSPKPYLEFTLPLSSTYQAKKSSNFIRELNRNLYNLLQKTKKSTDSLNQFNFGEISEDDLLTYSIYMSLYTGAKLSEFDVEFIIKRLGGEYGYDTIRDSLKKILNYRESIIKNGCHLYTVSISDEISDEPMGTIMIFSQQNISISAMYELHELAYDYITALRKVEITSQETYHNFYPLLEASSFMIKHELNNLFSSINSAIIGIQSNSYDNNHGLDIIQNSTNCTSIILNSYRKMLLDKPDLIDASISCVDLVAKIKKTWVDSRHQIELNVDDSCLFKNILGGNLLIGVVFELLRNASKHTPDSKIINKKRLIKIDIMNHDNFIKITIKNYCERIRGSLKIDGKLLGGRVIFGTLQYVYSKLNLDYRNYFIEPHLEGPYAVSQLMLPIFEGEFNE
ncbi:MAG: hypothetical protein KKF62_03060 [Bacteroidetes bacterium]|nr:hypothetical protein [Bacteroidota bacterium]MBU1115030.1 hypothetical protein [Bacteroidota bacterium]MBU1799522.1 hypothetical protein [Bacteroidota bacterium]